MDTSALYNFNIVFLERLVNILVMQRFGNLKVGSVFGFFHPETAVSVFGFQQQQKKIIIIKKDWKYTFSKKSSSFLKKAAF